ncbi:MAG TPA: acetate/propionate family kinase [Micropepsaceae bacterium]|nr:acetate/propionate family kinase [Micropepsaceae bacterium]
MRVVALNSGSSSLKFGVYDAARGAATVVLSGEAEWSGATGTIRANDRAGKPVALPQNAVATQDDAIVTISALFAQLNIAVEAVGHRVVHGGPDCRRHCVIDDAVMAQLQSAAEFAPLHVPPALSIIRYAKAHFGAVPQVACLDTAFHSGMPDVARIFALPRELRSEGVERFGFHGLSCESILRQLTKTPERLVIAHLGSGASVTAVRNGRSIDTSMGLTPTGGIIMGTRCGDLDPGVLIYLMRKHGFDAEQLEQLVDHRSGLLGISGDSSDMRELHRAAAASPGARLAIAMFCYSVRKRIAAMAAALGGIDVLVFTGGIGEHDAAIRTSICEALRFMNIGRTLTLPSLEDEQIALHTAHLSHLSR